ncbi:three component ABC system middle component [Brucella sp. TWI432]
MKDWGTRPIEVRNLFNPAFCGLILYRALLAFQNADARGMPFSMSLLILPLALQRHSREVLQRGNRNYLLRVIADHPELQVGFAQRCTEMLPFTLEALGFLHSVGTLNVSDDGRLTTTPEGVRKTVSGTEESKQAQRVAAFIGKEFASIGRSSTVYTTMGIRP